MDGLTNCILKFGNSEIRRFVNAMNLKSRLSTLIAVRVVVSTLLLGSAILVQLSSPGSSPAGLFFSLIPLTSTLSVIYLSTPRCVDRYSGLADAQLGADAI